MSMTKIVVEFDVHPVLDLDLAGRSAQEAHEIVLDTMLFSSGSPVGVFPVKTPGRVTLSGFGVTHSPNWGTRVFPANDGFAPQMAELVQDFSKDAREEIKSKGSDKGGETGEADAKGKECSPSPEHEYAQELLRRSFGLASAIPAPFSN